MDFQTIVGYLSGLYLIKPGLEASALFPTTVVVHILDAILCHLIAAHSGRNKIIWSISGLCFGIWALGTLFLLPSKKPESEGYGK